MGRKPENVHVYLYRVKNSRYEYAILHRADDAKCWQGISGGVEDDETPVQAALREAHEEAGVPRNALLYRLDTVSSLPATVFSAHVQWGEDVVVCPMFFYAIPFDGEITLSAEHTEYKWLSYDDAHALVYWHDQKTALWELDQRLQSGNLICAV